MKTKLLGLCCLMAAALPLAALVPLTELAQRLPAKPLAAAPSTQRVYLDSQDYQGGRLQLEARRSVAPRPDGGLVEEIEAPGVYRQITVLSSRGALLEARKRYLSPALVKAAQADELSIAFDPLRREWKLATLLGGRPQASKQIGENGRTVYLDALPSLLGALLAQGLAESCNADILLGSGDVVNADIRLQRTRDLAGLAPRYRFPARFKQALAELGPCLVFEMNFTGLAGVFYPHHFYYVWKDGATHPFVALFGEDPDSNPSYQIVMEDQ